MRVRLHWRLGNLALSLVNHSLQRLLALELV